MTSFPIALVIGTRPEVIKLAPVYKALKLLPQADASWISTGQHQQMLSQTQGVFGIESDVDLQLMRQGQTPLDVVLAATVALRDMWQTKPPAMVVVQGDTATAYAAAMAAFYLRIPVAHVEAGLRSYRIDEPFPEESHRRMIAAMTSLHFAPTEGSAENLRREGIGEEGVFTVGNTVVDALQSIPLEKDFLPAPEVSPTRRWVLVTAHRRENHGPRLRSICQALLDIRDAVEDVELIFPVHLNPQVQAVAHELLGNQSRIHLLPPSDYFSFVQLMRRSALILTDSGGVQEEAPSFRIPVLVLREQTERPEAVAAGMAKLVGSNREAVASNAIRLLTDKEAYTAMQQGEPPFGDGHSAERIARLMIDYLRHQAEALG